MLLPPHLPIPTVIQSQSSLAQLGRSGTKSDFYYRCLNSSMDFAPTLLDAFLSAQKMADTFRVWVSVYDSKGHVAKIFPQIHIKE